VTTCGVHGQSSGGDPLSLLAASDAPGYIKLQLSKTVWSIPSNTSIHLHVSFDNGVTVDPAGTGNGDSIKVSMGADLIKSWIHGFTAANSMDISFIGGTAASWSFSLVGTTPTINAMAECAKETNLYLPAPFNTGLAPGVPNNPDGQPFATDLTGETSQRNSPTNSPTGDSQTQTAATPAAPPASAGPVGANSSPAGPIAATAGPSCSSNWHSCKDNADLVNNSGVWPDAQAACQEKVNEQVAYGSPKWPGFWSGGPFTSFQVGSDYVSTGVVLAIEPNVQIQNQYGAMVHSTAYCRYDLNAKSVLNVWTVANDGSISTN
jgi:hypothetical protein